MSKSLCNHPLESERGEEYPVHLRYLGEKDGFLQSEQGNLHS